MTSKSGIAQACYGDPPPPKMRIDGRLYQLHVVPLVDLEQWRRQHRLRYVRTVHDILVYERIPDEPNTK